MCGQVSGKKQDKINSFYQFITFAIHNRTLLNLIRPQDYGHMLPEAYNLFVYLLKFKHKKEIGVYNVYEVLYDNQVQLLILMRGCHD